MNTQDLKYEIRKAIDEVPDTVLEDILEYLRQVRNFPPEKIDQTRHFRRILQEDKELLQRLAR